MIPKHLTMPLFLPVHFSLPLRYSSVAHYLCITLSITLMTGCAGVSAIKDYPPVVSNFARRTVSIG